MLQHTSSEVNGYNCYKHLTNKKISNGNRTAWRPIRSVIIRVIRKSDDRAINLKNYNFEKRKIVNLCDNRKIYIKKLTKVA